MPTEFVASISDVRDTETFEIWDSTLIHFFFLFIFHFYRLTHVLQAGQRRLRQPRKLIFRLSLFFFFFFLSHFYFLYLSLLQRLAEAFELSYRNLSTWCYWNRCTMTQVRRTHHIILYMYKYYGCKITWPNFKNVIQDWKSVKREIYSCENEEGENWWKKYEKEREQEYTVCIYVYRNRIKCNVLSPLLRIGYLKFYSTPTEMTQEREVTLDGEIWVLAEYECSVFHAFR